MGEDIGLSWIDSIVKNVRKEEEEEATERGVELGPIEPNESEAEEIKENIILLDAYDNVRIYRIPDEPVPIYEVKLPKLNKEHLDIVNRIRKMITVDMNINPTTIKNLDQRRAVVREAAKNAVETLHLAYPKDVIDAIIEMVVMHVASYGLLDPLLKDDNLEEIMVIGLNKPVYVWHRDRGMCKTTIVFKSNKEIMPIIEKIANETGRRIDQQSPLLDARLPDGSRVNATIPPVSLDGPTVTIRKFKKDPLTIIDLIRFNTLPVDVAAFLWLVVDGLRGKPANILIAGGTGSGKTTLLNSLALFIPPDDRVISIEDTAELQLPLEHWVRLETRPPNLEGYGEITMDDLLKNTLRMRPDRIIVGEVRGPEARTLLNAMNTGHDGCMSTIHANTTRDTITRLKNLGVEPSMMPALDFIIMIQRFTVKKGGSIRRIIEIAEVLRAEGENVQLNRLFKYDRAADTLQPTGVPSEKLQMFKEMAGISDKEFDFEITARAYVLNYLLEKGIRQVHDVGMWLHRYYVDPKATLQKIKEETGWDIDV